MNSGVLSFTKEKRPNSVPCTGNPCNGKLIEKGDIYWKSGHERNATSQARSSGAKRQPMKLCQKCFGFWLARYWEFDYNPFQIDKDDLKWATYWENDWDAKCMLAFFENLEIGKEVRLEVNDKESDVTV